MAGGSFFAGVEALKEDVGDGTLGGKVVVDQHYALEQHENMQYTHPRGGGPKYLSGPLQASAAGYLENLGDAVLGGNLVLAMAENMEDLSFQLDPEAPIDEDPNYFRLRLSGNPIVTDEGVEVYNRAPITGPQPPGSPGS